MHLNFHKGHLNFYIHRSYIFKTLLHGLDLILLAKNSKSLIQLRSSIQFCVRNQISGAKMLQKAFGDKCMSRASIFDWYKVFQDGRKRVDDEPRPGWPSTPTDDQHVNKVKQLVFDNRRLIVRDIGRISENHFKREFGLNLRLPGFYKTYYNWR